jgi:ABC-type multidrug transport system ATPase subunit
LKQLLPNPYQHWFPAFRCKLPIAWAGFTLQSGLAATATINCTKKQLPVKPCIFVFYCNRMEIAVQNIGKRFNKEWIFRHVNYSFTSNHSYAIIGKNGSGKSTLLQVIANAMLCSEGSLLYTHNNKLIGVDDVFKHMAIAAPYLDIIEEMTAAEFLNFHFSFAAATNITIAEMLTTIDLQHAAHKQIRYFSSGMKQRIKLAQAFFKSSTILLLDEPCTNLDAAGIALYNKLIQHYTANKIVIVCSNDAAEYNFCQHHLKMEDFKFGL